MYLFYIKRLYNSREICRFSKFFNKLPFVHNLIIAEISPRFPVHTIHGNYYFMPKKETAIQKFSSHHSSLFFQLSTLLLLHLSQIILTNQLNFIFGKYINGFFIVLYTEHHISIIFLFHCKCISIIQIYPILSKNV